MKSFQMIRDARPIIVIEFSFRDLLKLLFGREIILKNGDKFSSKIVIRQRLAYDMLNMNAPIVVKADV